jgi:Tfp pilus assembly protein PilV
VAAQVRILAREGGFTLPETLVTMVVGIVVLLAVSVFAALAMSHNTTVTERVGAMDQLDLAVNRLQDDVRQSYAVAPAVTQAQGKVDSATLTLSLPVSGAAGIALHTIRWDCSAAGSDPGTSACTRQDVTSAGPAETVLDDVTTPPATAFSVVAPVSGGGNLPTVDFSLSRRVNAKQAPVTLRSSVTPRNCQTRALKVDGTCQFP